jgi:N-methylhydantoinase B/oxoprolinase/acetone carboxylase alpha subunit
MAIEAESVVAHAHLAPRSPRPEGGLSCVYRSCVLRPTRPAAVSTYDTVSCSSCALVLFTAIGQISVQVPGTGPSTPELTAEELGANGIRVNRVQPGLVDDQFMSFCHRRGKLPDANVEAMPISRPGTVEDIAEAV